MATFFLAMIYAAFISLGLPDSLLGAAWPVMHTAFGVPLSAAGIGSMIIAGGTIISSLMADRLIRRFGTGRLTLTSVAMTAGALLGFSLSPSFLWLCVLAVPLGLGAGAVDAGLNNFVALHYQARHMSWLHCFWGLGATAGPMILSLFLTQPDGWRRGYAVVAIMQCALVGVLAVTLPLWKQYEDPHALRAQPQTRQDASPVKPLQIAGVPYALATFLCYCAVESTTGLWGASYLVGARGIDAQTAARWASLYYLGITVGRGVTGFATMRFSNKTLIRMGQCLVIGGLICLLAPLPAGFSAAGLICMGFGCAPVYPCMIHETPYRFGKQNSQAVIGLQMACAYVGSTFAPPVVGFIATKFGMIWMPVFLLLGAVIMALCSERLNRILHLQPGANA